MSIIPLPREIHYPESDGKPMAETEVHGQVLLDLIHCLSRRYAGVPDVYAWGNMLLYYEEGNPRACVAPDVFLVRGVEKRRRQQRRRIYKVWEEGKPPSLVLEVTSESTRREDEESKKGLYERLGVEELVLFDPLGDYLRPRLQMYRRAGGRFQRVLPEADGSLLSRVTGLKLRPEGERLRLVDAESGEPLPWIDEEAEARQAAEERAGAAEERAEAAEEHAEQERRDRQAAELRAEEEQRVRQAAEERLRALEEEVARLRNAES